MGKSRVARFSRPNSRSVVRDKKKKLDLMVMLFYGARNRGPMLRGGNMGTIFKVY